VIWSFAKETLSDLAVMKKHTDILNSMRLPAIIPGRPAMVTVANATARAILDWNINIIGNRLNVRDPDAYAELIARLDDMTKPAQLKPSIAEPIFVQRQKKQPVVLATIPFKEHMQSRDQEVHALLTVCRRDHGLCQPRCLRIAVI
jgi:hypothetical protein